MASNNQISNYLSMIGKFVPGICCLLFVFGCASIQSNEDHSWEAKPNSVMVVIEDPRSERRRRGASGPGYSARLAYEDDPILHRAAANIASAHGLNILQQWPLQNLNVHCFVVSAPSAATLNALRIDPRVLWVQPFNEFETQSHPPRSITNSQLIKQFTIQVAERGHGVKIAVIDTSVDNSHPDFTKSLLSHTNFAGTRGRPMQEEHGTAVVGLIAATPSNPKGLSGFASQAEVSVLRACWQAVGSGGKCNTLTLALALDEAINLQPDILNLSLTGRQDRVLQELIGILLDNGTLVIAAYDESRSSNDRFPSPATGLMYAYGGEHSQPSLSPSENILYAPREAMSLAPMASYDLVSGHSIAAPQISAIAACLMEMHPNASRTQIQSHLKNWLNQN